MFTTIDRSSCYVTSCHIRIPSGSGSHLHHSSLSSSSLSLSSLSSCHHWHRRRHVIITITVIIFVIIIVVDLFVVSSSSSSLSTTHDTWSSSSSLLTHDTGPTEGMSGSCHDTHLEQYWHHVQILWSRKWNIKFFESGKKLCVGTKNNLFVNMIKK